MITATHKHEEIGTCRFAQVDGRNVHLVEVGSGFPIVLIHGSQSWAYSWRYQIDLLAKAGHRVIVPDLPGSGYSDLADGAEYSISALSCFIGDMLDELKIGKAVFAASSAGGLPVLDLAIRCPDRVAGLVLSSSCGVHHDLPTVWKLMSWPLVGELMGCFLNEGVVRSNLQEAFYSQGVVTNEMVTAIWQPVRRHGF